MSMTKQCLYVCIYTIMITCGEQGFIAKEHIMMHL